MLTLRSLSQPREREVEDSSRGRLLLFFLYESKPASNKKKGLILFIYMNVIKPVGWTY
jgi:hypothetical protein